MKQHIWGESKGLQGEGDKKVTKTRRGMVTRKEMSPATGQTSGHAAQAGSTGEEKASV